MAVQSQLVVQISGHSPEWSLYNCISSIINFLKMCTFDHVQQIRYCNGNCIHPIICCNILASPCQKTSPVRVVTQIQLEYFLIGHAQFHGQPVRLADSYRCWFVYVREKYCWLVLINSAFVRGLASPAPASQPSDHALLAVPAYQYQLVARVWTLVGSNLLAKQETPAVVLVDKWLTLVVDVLDDLWRINQLSTVVSL